MLEIYVRDVRDFDVREIFAIKPVRVKLKLTPVLIIIISLVTLTPLTMFKLTSDLSKVKKKKLEKANFSYK